MKIKHFTATILLIPPDLYLRILQNLQVSDNIVNIKFNIEDWNVLKILKKRLFSQRVRKDSHEFLSAQRAVFHSTDYYFQQFQQSNLSYVNILFHRVFRFIQRDEYKHKRRYKAIGRSCKPRNRFDAYVRVEYV